LAAGFRLNRSNIGRRAERGFDAARGNCNSTAVPPANRVRIIGGRHRGRRVPVPDAPGLRPTPDRVRETLFNWLGQDLAGRTTLDLFAGTGVLTLEAQSRGAQASVAVDRNPALVRALAANARTLGLQGVETHVDDALRYLARESRCFDVVFLDPPFADDAWDALFTALRARVSDDGRIYAEAGRALDAPAGWTLLRRERAGAVHYHLLAPNGGDA
jgi:16S rRNA (guanine966-N2)-methyltransferase